MSLNIKKNSGFTLIELLVVVAITIIAATIVMYNMSGQRNSQALNNAEDDTVALLNQARTYTLSAYQGFQYGVHFTTSLNKIYLFSGTSYSTGTTTKEVAFDDTVTVSSTSFSGGGSDVIFNSNSGDTTEYGTLVIKNAATNATKTITITKNGFVSGN